MCVCERVHAGVLDSTLTSHLQYAYYSVYQIRYDKVVALSDVHWVLALERRRAGGT